MSLNQLQPWLRPYARALVAYFPSLRITSVYRSYSKQTELYRRYLAGHSRYPAAPPGYSKHQYGLAWDMIGDDETLRRAGEIWESWGGTWGGHSDNIHFEV